MSYRLAFTSRYLFLLSLYKTVLKLLKTINNYFKAINDDSLGNGKMNHKSKCIMSSSCTIYQAWSKCVKRLESYYKMF